MTIATANSSVSATWRHGADNRARGVRVGLREATGAFTVETGKGSRLAARGCDERAGISLSVGDGNTGAVYGGDAVTVRFPWLGDGNTDHREAADSAAGGALTLTAGIGDGSSGAVGGAVSIAGGVGANTGGAVRCDERRRDFGRLGLHDDRDRQLWRALPVSAATWR